MYIQAITLLKTSASLCLSATSKPSGTPIMYIAQVSFDTVLGLFYLCARSLLTLYASLSSTIPAFLIFFVASLSLTILDLPSWLQNVTVMIKCGEISETRSGTREGGGGGDYQGESSTGGLKILLGDLVLAGDVFVSVTTVKENILALKKEGVKVCVCV